MSARNDADGFNQSRSVLGDVTNRIGKRGFSEREKRGVKSYNSNDKDTVKHVRVSTELDLLKGDVLSKVSNVDKGLNVQDLESSFAFSEKSIVEINGKDAVKLSEKKADSPNVNPMFAVDKRSVNTIGDMPSSVHDALTMMDNISSRNCKDPSFTDHEMGRVINSLDSKADACLPFGKCDSLKDYVMLEIPNAVTENTSPNLTGTVKRNVVDVTRNSSGDVASSITKISKSSYLNLLDLGRGHASRCANSKAKNKLGDIASANTSSTVSETGSDRLLDCINCDAGETKVSLEVLPDSQESRIFGVEKSSEPKKGKECPNVGGGVDAIKTCSCSFCTKAAYIWLDLNYQDIRGRVSAMRKSQKEASILAERSRMIKETEGSTRMSKLEIDLMLQWNFLFQHMAGIWEQEGDHLETSLLPLTDLREKCKRDLGSD